MLSTAYSAATSFLTGGAAAVTAAPPSSLPPLHPPPPPPPPPPPFSTAAILAGEAPLIEEGSSLLSKALLQDLFERKLKVRMEEGGRAGRKKGEGVYNAWQVSFSHPPSHLPSLLLSHPPSLLSSRPTDPAYESLAPLDRPPLPPPLPLLQPPLQIHQTPAPSPLLPPFLYLLLGPRWAFTRGSGHLMGDGV